MGHNRCVVPEHKHARALVSYAHENASLDRRVRDLADRLRRDSVVCELDQYHDAPAEGWPGWMSGQVFDDGRFILVVASPSYARRWSLAERRGVGLGAKYEGRLIRQVLYSEEGLNGRVIPIVFGPDTVQDIPRELQDTTRYDVSTPEGYDRLLRRLTGQQVVVAPDVGDAIALLGEQTPALAAIFYILQNAPTAVPVEVLCAATQLKFVDLAASIGSSELAPWCTLENSFLSTTYYRPVYPAPEAPQELLSAALDALLSYVGRHGVYAATREQIDNALALAAHRGVRRDVVARLFDVLQKPLKRLGDKRLVWQAAKLSLDAAGHENRTEQDTRQEALALICGRSWVSQRVGRLDEAKSDAKRSLEIGERLKWHRNTAFCLKCLGRLSRMQAEVESNDTDRTNLLAESEMYLREAIEAFVRLDDTDRDDEVGECYSLLGRTLLVAGRSGEAKGALKEADKCLQDPGSKEFQDLQILHGDLVVETEPRVAEGFYSEVIAQGVNADAQYSEIRARAFYARGLCREKQLRASDAKKDFNAAADIWSNLQDPAESLAQWGALRAGGKLPIDQELLKDESPAVRVRAVRIHQERMHNLRARPARRNASLESAYVRRLMDEAKRQLAIEEIDWIARVTGERR
jgi:tetratricopeptide (TPR) repeat protein